MFLVDPGKADSLLVLMRNPPVVGRRYAIQKVIWSDSDPVTVTLVDMELGFVVFDRGTYWETRRNRWRCFFETSDGRTIPRQVEVAND